MGRNVICVEMEQHFIDPMKASWEKMRIKPMLGHALGQVLILRGDARALPLGSVDGVITSPPWESTLQSTDQGFLDKLEERRHGSRFQGGNRTGYTQVEAIVTSPPYEQAERRDQSPYQDGRVAAMMSRSYRSGQHPTADNIGNLRSTAYWQAMTAVYSECHRVLKPNGIMVLVLKGFTRDGKYVDLPALTQKCVEDLGFCHIETWQRELWNLSFWRILQQRRDPAAFDNRLRFEQVLAFRKDGDGGSGIEAVITSPPYEGSVSGDPADNKLFTTERRVNSPASGNRKSKRKLLGHGYTRQEGAMNTQTDTCVHHWVIEAPNGPKPKGVCQKCSEERVFSNSLHDAGDWIKMKNQGLRINREGTVDAD
ncbi:MAG: hypothetical protein V3W51_04635 [Candidatus Brocadiales bacterium]